MWRQRWWGWLWSSASCCWFALLLQRERKVQICISNSFMQFKQHPAEQMYFVFVNQSLFVSVLSNNVPYICMWTETERTKICISISFQQFKLHPCQIAIYGCLIWHKRPNGLKNIYVLYCLYMDFSFAYNDYSCKKDSTKFYKIQITINV